MSLLLGTWLRLLSIFRNSRVAECEPELIHTGSHPYILNRFTEPSRGGAIYRSCLVGRWEERIIVIMIHVPNEPVVMSHP